MKYLLGLVGLVAVFAAYTSIVLVRYTYVQASYMQAQHDLVLCLAPTDYDHEPCAKALSSAEKYHATAEAIGHAPKIYKLFIPSVAL